MSHLFYPIWFILMGAALGFGIALVWGYNAGKKKRKNQQKLFPSDDIIASIRMDAYVDCMKNRERNILGDLRRANPERCKAFGHSVQDMDITFWATALAGETGELCNLIKKMRRGDRILLTEVEKEAADVVIYLDLLCAHLNIDLQAAIVQKFNEVSDRVKSPIKL